MFLCACMFLCVYIFVYVCVYDFYVSICCDLFLCCRVVDYYSLRCMGNFQMLEKLNVIGRTSEFARLYGIEFENVLSRGSQVSGYL